MDKIEVVNPGQNYKVGDKLIFENEVFGGGLQSEVASIERKRNFKYCNIMKVLILVFLFGVAIQSKFIHHYQILLKMGIL